jgi:hypothetical protein
MGCSAYPVPCQINFTILITTISDLLKQGLSPSLVAYFLTLKQKEFLNTHSPFPITLLEELYSHLLKRGMSHFTDVLFNKVKLTYSWS